MHSCLPTAGDHPSKFSLAQCAATALLAAVAELSLCPWGRYEKLCYVVLVVDFTIQPQVWPSFWAKPIASSTSPLFEFQLQQYHLSNTATTSLLLVVARGRAAGSVRLQHTIFVVSTYVFHCNDVYSCTDLSEPLAELLAKAHQVSARLQPVTLQQAAWRVAPVQARSQPLPLTPLAGPVV